MIMGRVFPSRLRRLRHRREQSDGETEKTFLDTSVIMVTEYFQKNKLQNADVCSNPSSI